MLWIWVGFNVVAREVGHGGEEAWVLRPQLRVLRGNWASPLHGEESPHLPPLRLPPAPLLLRSKENTLMAYGLGHSEDHQIGEPDITQLGVTPPPPAEVSLGGRGAGLWS